MVVFLLRLVLLADILELLLSSAYDFFELLVPQGDLIAHQLFMSEFEKQLILLVHQSVYVALHLWDLVIEDAAILAEVVDISVQLVVLGHLLPLLAVQFKQLVLPLRQLLPALPQVRGQLILLVLVVGNFITDLHECALGGLESERVILVDLDLLLKCCLNQPELPLDHLVLSHYLAVVTS